MIPNSFSGGCACGAIHYESTAAPIVMLHCHCRDCQRSTGGNFAAFAVLPREGFRMTRGQAKYHATPSEAGGMNQRGFCAECGSPLLSEPEAVPQIVAIHAASLADPAWFSPQIHVWTCDAHPTELMDPALPKFDRYPPAGE